VFQGANPRLPGQLVPSAGIPTTVNSTQDEILVAVKRMVQLYADPPVFQVNPQVLSGNLVTRFVIRQAMAVLLRQPSAPVQIRGIGCAAPTL
jgi:hypothetical protein